MRLLAVLLLFGVVAFAVRPRLALSTLNWGRTSAPTTTPAPKKYSHLTSSQKQSIEVSILSPWFSKQTQAGARAYAGVARLCFHDAGTFNRTDCSGGAHAYASVKCTVPNACEYTNSANAGLPLWIDELDVLYDNNGLSSILSKADFWHLTCNYAIELTSGLDLPFQAGRTDPTIASPLFLGRLPDAGAFSEVTRVFINNLGFSWEETVALMGVHTLGGATQANSGYEGDWDQTANGFDNFYYSGMSGLNWFPHTVDTPQEGQPVEVKHQFSLGGSNYNNSLMFITDMGMLYDFDGSEPTCVQAQSCTPQAASSGFVKTFANSQSAFFTAFTPAWQKMQSLTCDTLYDVTDSTTTVTVAPSTTQHPTSTPQTQYHPSWQSGWNTKQPAPDKSCSSDGWGFSRASSPTSSNSKGTPVTRGGGGW